MKQMITAFALASALVLTVNLGTAATIYENNFESPADLSGWQILMSTGYGIVAGVTPCNTGQNVFWMYGEAYNANTYSTAYYEGGGNWSDYCFSVWGRVTSNWMPWTYVFFRVQGIGGTVRGITNGYMVLLNYAWGQVQLTRIVNGGYSNIALVQYPFAGLPWINMKIEAGSLVDPYAIKVYFNKACDSNYELVISTRDPTFASGSVAIGGEVGGPGTVRHDLFFDRVKVTTLDDGNPSETDASSWGKIKALYR